MMESIRRTYFWHYINFSALNRISELLNSINNILTFLISPEDTTEKAEKKQFRTVKSCKKLFFGGIKAIVWIFVSIFMGLLTGQLS